MLEVTKEITFDSAHRLMGHPGKCKSLHGHTYKLQVTLQGDTHHNGMVYDFGDMKKVLTLIVNKWDHATILEKDDPLAEMLKAWESLNLVITPDRPTAENMLNHLRKEIQECLPVGTQVVKMRLWETPTSFATWRLTA